MFPPSHMPSLPQASAILLSAQAAAQDKINRELFVGNTPPGTSELLLLHFVNSAMRRVGLCQPHETPVMNSRVNSKFAFIELVSAEMANRAMSLNGIPFLGAVLKVSRPTKYMGPNVPTKTWQDLTGQSLPDGVALDAEQEKMTRELFIGNTTPEMTESVLRDFLGNAMEQVGLTVMPGNPITACRVSGKFAFVEVRTKEEATNALNLNNIPFMGTALRVGRPSKWNGPPDHHGNWEDILAKYMAGEIQPNQPGGAMAAQTPALPQVVSRVVELQNMLSDEDLVDEQAYQEVLEDTREECSQFGKLISVVIPKKGETGEGKIFLEYETTNDAAQAIQALEGRTFDGRRVQATSCAEAKFVAMDYA